MTQLTDNQSGTNSAIETMQQAEQALDAAALAAQQIGKIAGMSDPEAMAQKLIELEERIKELESAVPALQQFADKVMDMFPADWKDKVHNFLVQHLGFKG